jgi:hypothetical protein
VQLRKRVDLLGRNGGELFYFLRTRFNSVRRQHQTPRAGPVEMTSVRRARLTVRTIDQQKINTVEDAAVARWTKSAEGVSIDRPLPAAPAAAPVSALAAGIVIALNITASRIDMPEARALGNLASCASGAPAANPHAEADQQVRPHNTAQELPLLLPRPCSADYLHFRRLLSRLSS